MTEGLSFQASLNKAEIVFSDSPKYFDNKSPALIEKKVP
jgi:hypothetical protein